MSTTRSQGIPGPETSTSNPVGLQWPAISPDIPPDMAVLLHNLEHDFSTKAIDQWTYINRREEILHSINKIHQQNHNPTTTLDPQSLESPIFPRVRGTDLLTDTNPPGYLVDILRHRADRYKTELAFMSLDLKGKEVSTISWEKLYLKAVKVAHEITNKLVVKTNDSVVLLYKDGEVVEFVVALFGCFMAGATAVPIHQDVSLHEVLDIIKLTLSRLLLYSESVARELDRLNPQSNRFSWPPKLVRWRTTDFGSAKKSELAAWHSRSASKSQKPKSDLAYIEFSRSPVEELRGIALSHRTIVHQMNCLNMCLLSSPNSDGVYRNPKELKTPRKVFLATLDIRSSIGLIVGVLFSIYSGNLLIWAPQKVMEIQGLYANIVSKFRASLLLADYIGLKRVTYDYQHSPNSTRYFSKTQKVNFASVKWALVNALTVDGEFMDILANRYLRPLGCTNPENVAIPMLTLSEYGGMVISMRDWLSPEGELSGTGSSATGTNSSATGTNSTTTSHPGHLSSVLIDKEELSQNRINVVEVDPKSSDDPETLKVNAFGHPLPDATLAVVNPELAVVVAKGEAGEIWVDSPCLSGGFYGLVKESKLIFHAKCRDANGLLEMDFLRTGLLGFTYHDKVYVLGLYEDRIRQRISWIDQKLYHKLGKQLPYDSTTRYHYSSHLLATLANEVHQVYDCTIFDVFIGNEYLPVAIVEAEVIQKVIDSGDGRDSVPLYDPVPLNEPVLNSIAQKCFDTLYKHHFLRLYCVMVVDCDTLPKIMRSGGREIANMLCKKRFLEGSLKAEYVKFFVRKSISMIPHGEDVIGGIWSPYVSQLRSTALQNFTPQITNVTFKEKTLDDKTGAPLNDFNNIVDILKFRVARSADSIAYHNMDHGSKTSSKPLTWKKFETRVYSVAQYLIEKAKVTAGKYIILMYSLSEEFVIAVYACFMCGLIPIPMLPFDSNRIGEDFPAFLGVIKDFDVYDILVNEEVEKFLKSGPIADNFKRMTVKRFKNFKIKNTTKLTKVSNAAVFNSRIVRQQADSNYRDSNKTALIWINFTSDHYRISGTLTHSNLLSICKVFKETCNLSSKSSIIGCVRHSSGIGFIQAVLLGVFLGTTTFLCSPVSYAENPLAFFLSLSRHRVKDVFATEQMLKYAAIKFTPKGFDLSHLKNMMISTEGRVEIDLLRKISKVFQPTKLSAASMSTVYNHCFNPMISTRSYMTVAPVDLYLDPIALRQGFISIVNQVEFPNALHIQDSGMVPVNTEVAIVNPETCTLCKEGEFGEIWINSEANLTGFTNGPKGPIDSFTNSQFMGEIVDGDGLKYLRTGDLGFLHHISIARNRSSKQEQQHHQQHQQQSDLSFQPLFVLGKISDTFETMGLHHFPIDIETTIESCHPDIYKNGSCVFKCGDYTILVCESRRKRNFASLVPIIINTVLSKHHLIVDIVAFMKKGEFPISRLGTKQRARIIDAWVQGVIPIGAQYGINYGENSMIQLVKEMEGEVEVEGMKNPAMSYY